MFDILKIIIALSCLLYASYHDLRTRLIPGWIWWLMGIPALIFYGIESYLRNPELLIMLVPLGAVLVEALIERDDLRNLEKTWPFFLMYLAAFGALMWGYISFKDDSMFLGALSATGISVFFFLLYSMNIIHGAADAKAMVMLSLLFYEYPPSLIGKDVPGVSVLFPFSLAVFLLASLIVALLPIYFLVSNLLKGDIGLPEMLFGHRMDIEEARKRKVWPMVLVEEGKIRRVLMPSKNMEIDWDAIENAGINRPWVTPKIPFILPITIGFVLSLLIGNPMAYFL